MFTGATTKVFGIFFIIPLFPSTIVHCTLEPKGNYEMDIVENAEKED